ncbi:hypothetical protein OTK51_20935 [Vibrio scophthalmi]|uniref:hypothetical protein n=1 Tax=Vibrio scophthalmi TaxID=45658 RepID=UPI0022837BF5|nr:hypothetical protein [Vibrio scophthalmi]MCY9805893.1 hypothetical protein [Vibrio scophthalmi]
MSVSLATGVTLIEFLNKSLETLKLVQQDKPDSLELQLHLATLTQQLSMTMVEASQLQGILAQKNEEIRQLQAKIDEKLAVKFDPRTEVCWADGDVSPYCPVCYESDNKLIHLSSQQTLGFAPNEVHRPHHTCRVCKKAFLKTSEKRI